MSKTEIMRRMDLTATTLKRLAETEGLFEEKYLMKVTLWQLGTGERPKFNPPPQNGQGQGKILVD